MFVSITRLRIRRWWFVPRFALHAMRSRRQSHRTPSFIKGCFARQAGLTFWTITVWHDDEAMRAFRNGGDHVRSMRHLLNWCDEASYVHWQQAEPTLPTATVAFLRLRDDGKLSKVRFPSPAHIAGEKAGFTEPTLTDHYAPARKA